MLLALPGARRLHGMDPFMADAAVYSFAAIALTP